MSELVSKHCEACQADAPRLSEAEFKTKFQTEIPHWQLVNAVDIPQLRREFTFSNFQNAMNFANKVGQLAEAENHHPAITVEWGKVTVVWWTHKIKGLHHNDVIMAAKSDQLF